MHGSAVKRNNNKIKLEKKIALPHWIEESL